LAADFVSRKSRVMTIADGDRSAVVAKYATSTARIVSIIGGTPLAAELVSTLARPGGNLTGPAFYSSGRVSDSC
jgi:hypothetical protein